MADDILEQETDEQQQGEPREFQFPPELGVYEPFDWTPEPFVTLSEKGKAQLLELCRNCAKRDMAARRMEVEQAWEAELFERGYQYLFPRRGGGWQLFSSATGKSWSQMQGAQVYETNIYGTHCEILTSALVRDIPSGRFEPVDPNSGPDVTAAEKAEEFKEVFAKNNDLKAVHTQAADYMCTDGRVLFYTSYVLDGQRFGFEDAEEATAEVPEDETDAAPASSRIPRGREILRVLGKLAHKVPMQAQDIHEMDFVQAHWDVHEAKAKARFPWIEKQIKPGGGVGEIGIDRIARINVALALEGGYVTGDTFNREVTITHTWLRPSAFYDIKDEEVRQEFFDNFEDGLLAVYAGDALAFVRNEGMDDHLEVLQALSGSGQNRAALMSKVISVQKRLNNWIDLLNDFFIRTVPTVWMDAEIFNVAALNNQMNVPGQRKPFQSQPGRVMQEIVFEEPMPTHQPALPEFIKFFFNDFPEMLSGALPSLFGAESNTDTASGIAIQRDQALGRLGTPWGKLQSVAATYNRQAVMCAAECRLARGESQLTLSTSGGRKLTMEVADLKGNVLCYPEEDSNFPETWVQKSSRYQQMLAEAPTNPIFQKVLALPQNLRLAKDAAGLKDLEIPEADAVDKQIAELEILLKRKPSVLPNPQIQQAQEQMAEAEHKAEVEGQEAVAKFAPMKAQVLQQLQQLPPEISSYPVAQDASEDHATEAQVCFSKMNSAEGRKLKNGNLKQQAAYKNLHLHWQEHVAMDQKLNPKQGPQKPPSESVSVSVDKMPPNIAAQLLQKFYGVPGSARDFEQQDATETEKTITEKAADYGRTGSLQ